jgi:hypothetical protein
MNGICTMQVRSITRYRDPTIQRPRFDRRGNAGQRERQVAGWQPMRSSTPVLRPTSPKPHPLYLSSQPRAFIGKWVTLGLEALRRKHAALLLPNLNLEAAKHAGVGRPAAASTARCVAHPSRVPQLQLSFASPDSGMGGLMRREY